MATLVIGWEDGAFQMTLDFDISGMWVSQGASVTEVGIGKNILA